MSPLACTPGERPELTSRLHVHQQLQRQEAYWTSALRAKDPGISAAIQYFNIVRQSGLQHGIVEPMERFHWTSHRPSKKLSPQDAKQPMRIPPCMRIPESAEPRMQTTSQLH